MKMNLFENIPIAIKRRMLNKEDLQWSVDNLIFDFDACGFSNVGELVAEVCEALVTNLEDFYWNDGFKLEPKERDSLYYLYVDQFGKYISDFYKKHCKDLKESTKKYVVTESQYKMLLKENSKIAKLQALVDKKFEYIKKNCENVDSPSFPNDIGFATCDIIDSVNRISVVDFRVGTTASSDLFGIPKNPSSHIFLDITIYFSSLKPSLDFDELLFDLKHMLRFSVGGIPIIFDKINTINENKSKDW